jgi:CubicO group peptidase (beta-lactamase class C family)
VAVQPDTPFQTGSISKVVFALAVMRLCQDKRIDTDAAMSMMRDIRHSFRW